MTIENGGSIGVVKTLKRRTVEAVSFFAFSAVTLQRFNGSTIDFDDKFTRRIDVAAIHPVRVEWQSDVTVLIDRN